ncbi:WD repeat protein [Trichophyton violaceum]|nr:WD repeat protein [Trichophyton violaceum]
MAFFEEGGEAALAPRPVLGPRRPRPVTDYGSSLVQWVRVRQPRYKGSPRLEVERPSASYTVDMLPPVATIHSAANTIPVRHLHQSIGKSKKPITVVRWTPDGRRLLTGGHTGEFMLWNGTAFNFETVMDAHYDQFQAGVTSAAWSHSHDWLISGGQKGDVKYWRPNFNNVETVDDAHQEAVRDLTWCPNDSKFLSASDDTTLKIFDFTARTCEMVLTGHGWDVKSCDWHPTKGLLVSGSKDHQVKFWDPRTGRCLTTLHTHKNTVTTTKFSPVNTNLLGTSSRDQTGRVFDLRMMRDICILRGHDKPISSLAWHPMHSTMISTGSEDGSLYHYLLDEPNLPAGQMPTVAPYGTTDPTNTPAQVIFPAHKIQYAHGSTIWSLDWHPLGHILASGSKDNFTRFWSRARPGEINYLKDRFHIGEEAAEAQGTWNRGFGRKQMREEEEQEAQAEDESRMDQRQAAESQIPGIQNAAAEGQGIPGLLPGIGALQPPPPPPPNSSGAPPALPQMDPGRLAAMLSQSGLPPPPPPPGQGQQPPFPHGTQPPPPPFFSNPNMPGSIPPNIAHMFPNPQFPPPGLPPQNFGQQGYPPSGLPGLAELKQEKEAQKLKINDRNAVKMARDAEISVNERAFILEALHKNLRLDGRRFDQLRPVELTFGDEHGNVKVQLGKTAVLVRISAELTTPRPERDCDGIFTVVVELNDMALPGYETGRPSELEVSLSRTLDKIVRRSNALDTESLCIAKGRICWNIRADIHILDCDGGLIDASCLAIMAGLLHFRLPESTVRDGEVTVFTTEEKVPVQLNLTKIPLSVTFNLYDEGKIMLLDATTSEEAVSEGSLVVALDKTGEIALYSKPDGAPADPVNMVNCSTLALEKVRELNKLLAARLEEEKQIREKKRPTAGLSAAHER